MKNVCDSTHESTKQNKENVFEDDLLVLKVVLVHLFLFVVYCVH